MGTRYRVFMYMYVKKSLVSAYDWNKNLQFSRLCILHLVRVLSNLVIFSLRALFSSQRAIISTLCCSRRLRILPSSSSILAVNVEPEKLNKRSRKSNSIARLWRTRLLVETIKVTKFDLIRNQYMHLNTALSYNQAELLKLMISDSHIS